jgi:hypothetical protein
MQVTEEVLLTQNLFVFIGETTESSCRLKTRTGYTVCVPNVTTEAAAKYPLNWSELSSYSS